jgi:glycosyltransferase involved in cell wall biosynthesis
MPLVLARQPRARLVVAGSDPPPVHAYSDFAGALQLLGYVDDVREPLAKYSVFICPILSGSGVRVKLLEAFAAGIPVVSTYVGAEGLASNDGEFCRLADDPSEFADRVVALFENSQAAADMAARARAEVVANWDMAILTRRLVDGYRDMVRRKRA